MEDVFYLSFSISPGIGPKRFATLTSRFGSAENAWNAEIKELREALGETTAQKFDKFRQTFDSKEYLKSLEKEFVTFVSQRDKQYPSLLKKLEDAPIGLFVKGNILLLTHSCGNGKSVSSGEEADRDDTEKAIAVVGTRKITSYGREVTEQLVEELTMAGLTIVSGLALGVDAAAHKAALTSGGKTIAVLGCGVNCCYPRENENLYLKILEKGGAIVSEYPLYQKPSTGTFPARNRIIAALSSGVLITEASYDSGSLITADEAKRLGRPVFAVPGPITSSQSAGTSHLLKNGAHVITRAQDILNVLNISSTAERKKHDFVRFSQGEQKILRLLESEEMSIDALSKRLRIPVQTLSSALSLLELRGIVKNTGGNVFQLI